MVSFTSFFFPSLSSMTWGAAPFGFGVVSSSSANVEATSFLCSIHFFSACLSPSPMPRPAMASSCAMIKPFMMSLATFFGEKRSCTRASETVLPAICLRIFCIFLTEVGRKCDLYSDVRSVRAILAALLIRPYLVTPLMTSLRSRLRRAVGSGSMLMLSNLFSSSFWIASLLCSAWAFSAAFSSAGALLRNPGIRRSGANSGEGTENAAPSRSVVVCFLGRFPSSTGCAASAAARSASCCCRYFSSSGFERSLSVEEFVEALRCAIVGTDVHCVDRGRKARAGACQLLDVALTEEILTRLSKPP